MKSLFIVFEGVDGSGTSTQASLLQEYFNEKNCKAVLTCEPSSGLIGSMIRLALKKRVAFTSDKQRFDEQMAYLFAADRHDRLYNDTDGVYKLLGEGFHVISTRYYFSSLAYQGNTPEALDFVRKLNERFPNPDLTIYVDTPIDLALKRLDNRATKDVYEHREKLIAVSKNYQEIFANYAGLCLRVDGSQSKEVVRDRIVSFIDSNFS